MLADELIRDLQHARRLLRRIDQVLRIAKGGKRHPRLSNTHLGLDNALLRLCDGAPLGTLVQPVDEVLAERKQPRVDIPGILGTKCSNFQHGDARLRVRRDINHLQIILEEVLERPFPKRCREAGKEIGIRVLVPRTHIQLSLQISQGVARPDIIYDLLGFLLAANETRGLNQIRQCAGRHALLPRRFNHET